MHSSFLGVVICGCGVLCGALLLGGQWDMQKCLCEDMRPPGNVVPQRTPAPYYIKPVWTPHIAVGIFVYGYYSLNNTFRGMLIQVRANATPIGTFSRCNSFMAILNCPPGKRNLVYNASRQKQLMSFVIWRPPPEYLVMDNIAIHATVIRERGIFWHIKESIPSVLASTTTEFTDPEHLLVYDGEFPLMVDSKTIKSDYYY